MNAEEWQTRFIAVSRELAWLVEGEEFPDADVTAAEGALLEELDDLELQAGRAAMQDRR